MTTYLEDTNTLLEECSWNGLAFPIELVGGKGGKRNAVHHLMDVQGAQIEDTGRLPYEFTVRAYFLNGLTKGINETWPEPLFPEHWAFVKASLEGRGSGVFGHPLYGEIGCKPVVWSETFTADVRSGVIVEMSFIEDLERTPETQYLISDLPSQARSLDSAKIPLPPGEKSWEGAVLTIDLLNPFKAIAKITNLVENLYNTIDKYRNKYSPYGIYQNDVNSIYAFIDSLNGKKDGIFALNRETAVYTVLKEMTLSTVANIVENTIDNLLMLNPSIINYPTLKPGFKVTYYV
jgi:hypothetical protein